MISCYKTVGSSKNAAYKRSRKTMEKKLFNLTLKFH